MSFQEQEKSLRPIFGGFKKSDFSSIKNFLNSPFFGWITFIALVTSISLLLSFHIDSLPSNIRVGRVAPKDIKADQNYELVDERATEANRQEAFKSVLPVYDLDEQLALNIDQQIQKTFQEAKQVLGKPDEVEQISQIFLKNLGLQPTEDQVKALVEDRLSLATEMSIRNLVTDGMTQYILSSRTVLPFEEKAGFTLRMAQKLPPDNEVNIKDLGKLLSLEEAQKDFLERVKNIPKEKDKSITPLQIYEISSRLLAPNLSFNPVETELRKAKTMSNVRNVIIKVQAGEAIVRGGDRYEPHHLTILEGIRKQKSETSFVIKFLGTALFVSLLLLITYAFSKRYIRKFNPTRDDLYFLGGVLVLLLLSVRLSAGLSSLLRDLFPYDISIQALYFAIPVAAGAMLTRYILNSEIALIFAIVASALTGMFLEVDLDLSIYYLLSSIAAASFIAHVDRRSQILRAGVMVGVINALMVLAIKLIKVVSVTDVFNLPSLVVSVSLGFLGGLLAAIFVMVLAPIVEMIFNYVTDIKLLELGNLNHPLLRDMIVKAPGTYHHSQLVAVLAEAAAAEIGANPLLARVGSYFHDIGKMRKPSYFIENQEGGENRHDKLAPSMSALIIASHVKDGMDLAKEHHLPQRILDFIPQHQGTKLITFFYNRAVEQNPDKDVPIDEKKYRYPGPRPQTREAGIILLADGVEATVRALPEKMPQKIRATVQKIINRNFTEEQLDECDMTLRDLHMIAESFIRVLVGIYHQRIEYPEIEEKKATVTAIKDVLNRK